MDFGIYPPEITSGRMYAGPGSGPLLAAAQAWGSLADELYTAATAYQSVISELTAGSTWAGPSATTMSAAAGSYVEWLTATAAQSEQTAAQARAAAAGYEAAFAMTVPPPEIAANRSLLAALVATNFLGINTPAIAATEAQYAEMWAQDAAAMYGYAGSSAAATVLTPFSSPHQNTDPGSTADQAAAVSQAAGNAESTEALSGTATTAQSDPLDMLANLISVFLDAPTDLVTMFAIIPGDALSGPVDFPVAYVGTGTALSTDDTVSGWQAVQPWPGTSLKPPEEFRAILTNPGPLAGPAPTVSVSLGEANTVGRLSVPSGWTTAAAEVRPVALTSPLGGPSPTAAVPAIEAGTANTVNQMGIGGMAGQAMAGAPPATAATGQNGKAVIPGRPAAGNSAPTAGVGSEATPAPRTVVTGVAAAIRLIAKQRDEGHLSEQEYTEQKQRLLDISARHRPLG